MVRTSSGHQGREARGGFMRLATCVLLVGLCAAFAATASAVPASAAAAPPTTASAAPPAAASAAAAPAASAEEAAAAAKDDVRALLEDGRWKRARAVLEPR